MVVGREHEREELARLVSGVRAGRSGALVLRGPAGIGKTALLDTVLRESGEGVRVLRAAGVEEESDLPFAALHQVLSPLLADLAELPEPQAAALRSALGHDRGDPDRFLVALGTSTLLATAAARTPLLLVVEDAHRLAPASARTLTFAARRLADVQGVGLLFTARDTTPPFPAPHIGEMRVGPLDAEAARALLAISAPTAAEDVRARLLSEAQGSPLALVELPGALSAGHMDGSVALPRLLPLTERLRHVFRTDTADPGGCLLLAAASHDGDLCAVLGACEDQDAGTAALGTAAAEGILQLDRHQVRFRHPLVRSAVYQSATVSERRAAHLSLARAAGPGSTGRVLHLAEATLGTDDAVAEAVAELARNAAPGAAAAAELLGRAAELAACPALRLRCLIDAAASSWAAADTTRAAALLEEADALAETTADQVRLDYVRALVCQGAEAASGAGPAAASFPAAPDDADPWLRHRLAALAARSSWTDGRAGDPVRPLLATPAPPADDAPVPWCWLPGPRPHLPGLTAPDVPYLRRHVELLQGAGAVAALPGALYELSAGELLTGAWSQARAHGERGLTECERTGRSGPAGAFHALLAWLAAVRGDLAAHRDHATAALAGGDARTSTRAVTQWARGLAALAESRSQDAFHHFQDVVTAGSPAAHGSVALLVYPDLIEVALRTGREHEARGWLARFEAAVDARGGGGYPHVAGLDRAAALLAGDGAQPAFEKALASAAPAPFAQGRVRLLYGNWLRRQRRVIDARDQLRLAVDRLESLGAVPWAAQARGELRAAGVRKQSVEPDGPARPACALTPQELQIATYAARGMRNSEIAAQLYLSQRTVSYHLHKVFPKLGITSRHQLHELMPFS
ncbi:AAA family ATPase [Streptomyces sp. NPDC047028]|uniref:AAA family ATPase n=1 Tax=Streptomyces sp. NPDC047028 TaxID=3155793 RepID=UPI0034096F66